MTTTNRLSNTAAMLGVLLLSLSSSLTAAETSKDSLERAFRDPPNAARPRVWWHWMNGNVSKKGIKLDLEWMQRIGLGGFQIFDAALGTPQFVDQRLGYMTPEWKDAFRYATVLADQLGLEEAIAASPGYTETGGPWVKPANAMKKVVWSETLIRGGRPFVGKLPKPPSVSGPFQDLPTFDVFAALAETGGPIATKLPEVYADSAVIAYQLAQDIASDADLKPKITASNAIDLRLLSDGALAPFTELPKGSSGQTAWIQYEFASPRTMRAVTIAINDPFAGLADEPSPGAYLAQIEASNDGKSYRQLADIPVGGSLQHTIAFAATTARLFRLRFAGPTPTKSFVDTSGFDAEFWRKPPTYTNWRISELVFHSEPRVNRFEEKAGFANALDLDRFATPEVSAHTAISKRSLIDVTDKMRPDGTLHWTPPPGRWRVLRFGYSLTGAINHPASPEGTGFEVDKLNREHVQDYMNTYLEQYQSAVGDLMGKRGLRYVVNDSWEAHTANWTEDLIGEFTRRRGYDPRLWLPVLTGRVVESAGASDRFLWDFRKTLGELLTEYHYDQINDMLHQRGMGHYGESHEHGRAFIGDGMEVKRGNDVPMSAMWVQSPGSQQEPYSDDADIRESASVAHIYGQNLVAAESMTASTGAYTWSPATLKATADKEMAMGVNRIVIHTSVHQPLLDRKPGLSLGPYGQWFTRNETWAELAQPWITYLSRSCELLQQGRFVADVAYFYGEDSNITAVYRDHFPDVPDGYAFDYVNADALIHQFSVSDGRLTTPGGASYRVLALDPRSQEMSLPVLHKIRDLVEAGAVVVGDKPQHTPSLADDEGEFHALVDRLWGSGAEIVTTGRGKVLGGHKLSEVLRALQLAPDFESGTSETHAPALFVHRTLPDGEVYYVDNRSDRILTTEATFRVQNKAAELWHADTGTIEPTTYDQVSGGTRIPLRLEPWGTVFVVFRTASNAASRQVPAPTESTLAMLDEHWTVNFQPDRGAPDQTVVDQLVSWHESGNAGIRYFSGTARYVKTLVAPASWFKLHARLWIDLGSVKNLAQVSVNGELLGTVWKAPYRVDATEALKAGANLLEINVTNAWANRIIGDRQPSNMKAYTFTSPVFYRADSPLQPSGLLGPVQIIRSIQE